ncbi:MAG: DUF3179 domain-containing (seleno)protein [Flavobacteriaceae bacterium]
MKYFLFLLAICFFNCKNTEQNKESTSENPIEVSEKSEKSPKKQRPSAHEKGKFFTVDEKQMLYGGKDSTQHFDITGYSLKDEQFHYGIGREVFPALLKPEFITIQEADSLWKEHDRFLVAYAGDQVKAYSIKDLTRHEVVNDELNGEPIMAVYCVLADLGAIYDRQYGNEELTFALSGYTYYDDEVWDGLDGFVLWDRETESLWWPLIDKAVSGPLKGVELLEKDKTHWEDTTWAVIKEKYPDAQILKSNQDFERPKNWNTIENVSDIIEDFSKED